MPKQQHKKLLHGNVTKTYKKAPPKLERNKLSSLTWVSTSSV